MRITFLICTLLFFTSHIHAQIHRSSVKLDKLEKKWNKLSKSNTPKNFILIPGGEHLFERDYLSSLNIPQSDTNTLADHFYEHRIKRQLTPYAISKTEVTNKEYRAFINWVIDSIALSILAAKDPSYFTDLTAKNLNWNRRNEVIDSTNFEVLKPLYRFIPDTSYKTNGRYQIDPSYIAYRFQSEGNKDLNSLLVYPDTLCWARDDPYNSGNFSKTYFSRPYYQEYPVVGVSWEQAQAYCDWLSRQGTFTYRLPTSYEFERAYDASLESSSFISSKSGRIVELIKNRYPYPWSGFDLFGKGDYLANFGSIIDNYNHILKSGNLDGAYLTSKIGAYPPSLSGLYDLAGNVSEWLSDTIPTKIILQRRNTLFPNRGSLFGEKNTSTKFITDSAIILNITDSLVTLIDKVFLYYETDSYYGKHSKKIHQYWKDLGSPEVILPSKEYCLFPQGKDLDYLPWSNKVEPSILEEIQSRIELAKNCYHNFKIAASINKPRAIMGGSFFDGPLFMKRGVKQLYDEKATHSKIGFRVVTDIQITQSQQKFLEKHQIQYK